MGGAEGRPMRWLVVVVPHVIPLISPQPGPQSHRPQLHLDGARRQPKLRTLQRCYACRLAGRDLGSRAPRVNGEVSHPPPHAHAQGHISGCGCLGGGANVMQA
jgi:hypothetical protein